MQRTKMERTFSEGEQEIDLYSNSRERQQYDEQANLYAIITATEHLERAYARDDITREEVSVHVKSDCMSENQESHTHAVYNRMQQAHLTVSSS